MKIEKKASKNVDRRIFDFMGILYSIFSEKAIFLRKIACVNRKTTIIAFVYFLHYL